MRLLIRDPGDDQQERQRQRQPPEACGDRADVGKADQPRPKGERDIAEQKGREGEAVRVMGMAGQIAPSC